MLALLLVVVGLCLAGEPTNHATTSPTLDLVMPGARPSMDDDYLCSSFDVSELSGAGDKMSDVFVTGFVPNADANKAHHMLLYSCDQPLKQPGVVYDCLHHALCQGGQSIMFAWAKNAPPTTLPQGVSFTINPAQRRYLVLQIHYAHKLSEPDHTGLSLTYQVDPTKYTAGILLMLRGGLTIPANTPVVHGDVNCKLPSTTPLHMFAYRTHAHKLSPVITGYVYNEEGHKYREIARGSPQWPQAFYPMKQVQTVNPGEVVTARCTYNSTGVNHVTNIGSTAGDEMCNLYIMFFTEPGKVGDYLMCANEQEGPAITRGLPADSDKPPAAKPGLEAHAKDSSVDAGDYAKEINYAKLFQQEQQQSTSKKKGGLEETTSRVAYFNMTMPGTTPTRDDDYICTGVAVKDLRPEKLWAVEFSALSTGNRAHHMIVSKCKVPVKTGEDETWDCRHHAMCKDSSKIMFAWAKHAAPTELPDDVGFQLEKDDYLVLQVHYAHPLLAPDHSGIRIKLVDKAPKYTAGMFLLLRSHLDIPADTTGIHGDVNCQASIRSPIHVFAYRTHAHTLGSVISGYRYSPQSREWTMLAKGNPNWPQAFYPMQHTETVNPGEILAARCTYNTTGHHTPTRIGATGGDEMCNLYLMFYTLSSADDFIVCADEQNPALTSQLPFGNDVPLPPNPALEHQAGGTEAGLVSYNNGHPDQSLVPTPDKKGGNSIRKRPGVDTGSVKKKGGVEPNYAGAREPKTLPASDLSVVPNWPTKETEERLGQISGVAIDIYGNAIIFHRGDRTWNGMTFKGDNTYGLDKDKPIPMDTVLTVNASGHTINSWGKNMFFLPHMITVDKKNNIWLTDVALHQVFKFSPYGGDHRPLIALGERFVPGSDDKHYCKPTAVAVSDDTTSFFVSDGYCNSRVIKYGVTVTQSGTHEVKKLFEWGKGSGPFTVKQGPNSFNIPHGLALAEDRSEVCVADRENGRVQCFSLDGDFTRSIKPQEFGSRIFSVAYTQAKGGQLHAVSGPEFSINPFGKKPTGYIVSMESGLLTGTWNVPGGLQNPHDIAVSPDGNVVYVVELNPFKVWKLTNGAPQSAPPSPPLLPPTPLPAHSSHKVGVEQLVPENINSSVVLAAAISVPLTLLVALCLACRKCRKKGKGTMVNTSNKSRFKDWNVGDILGRNKDGFQPVNTDERDGMLDDDSDSEVEEFSIPANHA